MAEDTTMRAAWLSAKDIARAEQEKNPRPHGFLTTAAGEAYQAKAAAEKREYEAQQKTERAAALAAKTGITPVQNAVAAAPLPTPTPAPTSAKAPSPEVEQAITAFERNGGPVASRVFN